MSGSLDTPQRNIQVNAKQAIAVFQLRKPAVKYRTRSSELMTGCNINVSTEQVIVYKFTPSKVKEKNKASEKNRILWTEKGNGGLLDD